MGRFEYFAESETRMSARGQENWIRWNVIGATRSRNVYVTINFNFIQRINKSFDIRFSDHILFDTNVRIEFCYLTDRRTKSTSKIDSFLTLYTFSGCENI